MLVARFSSAIESDINRGWSAVMTPGLGGSIADCEQDIADGYWKGEIREFPESPGCYGIVHHTGLSCYYLESEELEEAVSEVINDKGMDGSGFAYVTVGEIKLLKTISAKEIGSVRDLHILEVEDCESEDKY